MQMVGHKQKNMQVPAVGAVIENRIVEQKRADNGQAELIHSTLLTANSEKKPAALRHEGRRGMVQSLAIR
jgi:hypothetical protein